MDIFQFFFSLLTSLRWLLSEIIIRYPIIIKTKFGGNFVTWFSRQKMPKSEKQKHIHFFCNGEFYIVAKFQVNCVKNKRMNKGRRFWCHICPPCWVCFRHAIGQFGALSLFTSEKKSLNKVIRRLWTLRAWMLTLSFNILKCVYL